jgi:hypothetical protein
VVEPFVNSTNIAFGPQSRRRTLDAQKKNPRPMLVEFRDTQIRDARDIGIPSRGGGSSGVRFVVALNTGVEFRLHKHGAGHSSK